jgi:hypothetical protein
MALLLHVLLRTIATATEMFNKSGISYLENITLVARVVSNTQTTHTPHANTRAHAHKTSAQHTREVPHRSYLPILLRMTGNGRQMRIRRALRSIADENQ